MSEAALPPSLYAETAEAAPVTAPLAGDTRVSVAIVGGGYTGLSTALHLAEAGVDVAVLEANAIGWGCSGRNGGQVNPGLKPDPDTVLRDFGPDLGQRMVDLAYAAPERVFGLIQRHAMRCEARQGGTLRASVDRASAGRVASLAQQCISRGMPVAHLGATAVIEATGTRRYRSALLDRRGGSLNPLGYARGLARAAIAAGAAVHTGTRALGLAQAGTGWAVRTAAGTVTAERIVVGTNGYTDDLWPGMRQSLVPVYSAIAATEPLGAELAPQVMPGGSVLYETGRDTVYYRVDAGGRLLMGGRGPQSEPYGPDDYAHLRRYALHLWPALHGARWTHHWFGQIAVTPDHYPHLVEPAPNAHLAFGYNGRGVAMATTMGALLARRILGAPSQDIDLPIRTRLEPFWFHDLWRIGVNARMAYGRVMDRLGV